MPVATTTEAARAVASNAARNARAQKTYHRDTPPITIDDARAEPPADQLFRMPEATLPDPPAVEKPASKDVSICIEAGPAGITVRLDYVGTLGSIPAALEKLRASGVLDLVRDTRSAPATQTIPQNGSGAKKPAKRVTPAFDADGDPICPVHHKPLVDGDYGLYCPSKAQGEGANAKGYCNLKFDV